MHKLLSSTVTLNPSLHLFTFHRQGGLTSQTDNVRELTSRNALCVTAKYNEWLEMSHFAHGTKMSWKKQDVMCKIFAAEEVGGRRICKSVSMETYASAPNPPVVAVDARQLGIRRRAVSGINAFTSRCYRVLTSPTVASAFTLRFYNHAH